jgi:guanine deaminase
LSNAYFSDAVFPLRRMLARGMHIGLGTDIAGGASASILDNARQAVIASRLLESGVDSARRREERGLPESRIDALTALWLATVGGGIALDLPIGAFVPGYQFDAIVIDGDRADCNWRLDAVDAPDAILEKIIYGAARANIRDVWVAGRLARSASEE